MERKLTAILCADVYGYSRLMGEDEEATLHTLTSHRRLIDSQIEQHHGRFVNSAGDSVLAEFASVVEAVNCAVDIQTALKAENAKLLPERRMEFRIGVNLGDVMIEGDQIYGDGITRRCATGEPRRPRRHLHLGNGPRTGTGQARARIPGQRRANGQEYRASGARVASAVERDHTASGNTSDSTQVLAGRRAVVCE